MSTHLLGFHFFAHMSYASIVEHNLTFRALVPEKCISVSLLLRTFLCRFV